MLLALLRRWKREHENIIKYSATVRTPFYDLARKYLPKDSNAIVIDIGPGEGDFVEYGGFKKYPNHLLLDVNPKTVEKLTKRDFNACEYRAPDKLPLKDDVVSFIHASHIVEHISYQDLYVLLKDFDRVLKVGGVLVISTPLLWDRFYEDLSHIKPYNPEVFIHYMTRLKENPTQAPASTSFVVRELQYRYRIIDVHDWSSRFFPVDIFIRIFRILRAKLGFRRYIKNGYTIVLEKTSKNTVL